MTKRMTAEDRAKFNSRIGPISCPDPNCLVCESNFKEAVQSVREDRRATLEAAAERLRKYLAHTNKVDDATAIALILRDEED